jgi:hypothetical protein
MLTYDVIAGIMLLSAGAFVILARFRRWRWFMNHYKVQNIDEALGESGADLLYSLTSLVFMILGVLLILNLI